MIYFHLKSRFYREQRIDRKKGLPSDPNDCKGPEWLLTLTESLGKNFGVSLSFLCFWFFLCNAIIILEFSARVPKISLRSSDMLGIVSRYDLSQKETKESQ